MEFLINLFIRLTFLLAPALAFCIYKLYLYHEEDTLRKSVAWCITQDDKIRNNLSLISYINKKQFSLNIPDEYRLRIRTYEDVNDKEFINNIILDYRTYLTQSYFSGYLSPLKSKYVLDGEYYFWISLMRYLCEQESRHQDLCGKQLFYYVGNETILTEHGIIFYKLLYISYLANKEIGYNYPIEAEVERVKKIIVDKNR